MGQYIWNRFSSQARSMLLNGKITTTLDIFCRWNFVESISLRQGRSREGRSEGNQRQSCKLTDRNAIEGRDPQDELAQHNEIL
jgi:hypothetical protein